MNFELLGKRCISESLKVLNKSSPKIIQLKGPTKNVQITADLKAQKAIIDILKRSGQDFFIIAEEKRGPMKIGQNTEIEVYIDPLDGSSYFLAGNKRLCSTSLMFIRDGRVLASFVGDLLTGDMYWCDEKFAYFNNKRILINPRKKGERYMIASYAIKGDRIKRELPKLANLAQEKILVLNNSGPLEQAQIITGQFDAVVDLLPLSLWDYCGTAVAQKAGAIVSTREGKEFQFKNVKQTAITARNQEIHQALLKAFNK